MFIWDTSAAMDSLQPTFWCLREPSTSGGKQEAGIQDPLGFSLTIAGT